MKKIVTGIVVLAAGVMLAGCATVEKSGSSADSGGNSSYDNEMDAIEQELRANVRSMMDPSWCEEDIFGDETREDAIETMNGLAGGDLSDAIGEGAGMDLGEDSVMDDMLAITVDEQFDYCESL